ncbi:hypothetical protein DB31_3876 [Hyalangium minutum]|uniref:Pesticidal crystal protein Cry22Aa Ig-like domain-containing protein n=2 Tax=Hyalangium minutum TaxID=394096 RepID=A0A085W4Z9_9BACT|nr:hypothetical protein DB31_3876 [Hyalangium minutum]
MLVVTLAVMACGQESQQAASEAAAPTTRQDELAQFKALILARTVAGGTESVEYQAAKNMGFPVTLASDEQWAGMTAEQFAEYRVIILGDANCASLNVASAALANRHVWGPVINGNVLIAGTAPVANGATSVTEQAIQFAAYSPGQTGLYLSLSCYYQNAAPETHVELLESFGEFSVQGGGCHASAHVVGEHPALANVTDAAMSNWPCSVNAQFDRFPKANFAPLSVAEYSESSRGSAPVHEFTDGRMGAPYILARGVNLLGCGNYEQEVGEECDYGYESNGLAGSECSATCQLNWCGDGIVNPGEDCDLGSENGQGVCPRSCRTIPAPPPPPPPTNRPPVARCRPVHLSAGPSCGGVGASINDGSFDPDDNLVGCVQSATAFEVGSTQATLTCTDAGGQVSSCTALVNVVDDSAPSISCPAASSFECGTAQAAVLPAHANDNCVAPFVTHTLQGEGYTLGTPRTVRWLASDGTNEATCSTSITMVDTLAPSLTLRGAAQQQLECGVGSYSEAGYTASDLCAGNLVDSVSVSSTVNAKAVGTYGVSYRVVDGAGQEATASRSVKVVDTLAPVLSLVGAQSLKLECGVDGFTHAGATAVDACSGTLTDAITYSGTVDTKAVGNYSVTARVVDGAGLAATAVRSVEVADTKAPVLSLVGAQSMQVECGGSFTNPGATATDACSGPLTGAITYSSTVNTAAVGSYNVTARVVDGAGLESTAVRTVAVADTKAPVVTLSGASLVNVECGVGSYTEAGASATDVCTGDVSNRLSISGTVNTAARGTYTKTYSVTDVSGNQASATRTVKVNDTLAPSIALVGAQSLKLECGVDSFTNPGATAVDACAGNLTGAIAYSGAVNTAVVGNYTVNASVADAVGLSATAVRSVQVADTKAPVITLNGASAMTLECGVGTYTEQSATAADACTGNVTSRLNITGTVNTAVRGTYTKNYSVTDVSGNVATATRTVTVNDTLAPTVTLAGSATMSLQVGSAYVEPGSSATDSCSGTLTVTKTGTVNTAVPGTYTLTYTARDAAGLSASKTRTVTVVGNTCNTTITVKPTQQIWPPNHNYQTFTLSDCAAVTTNCGPDDDGGCGHGGSAIDEMGKILSIYSDEVEDANGNGDGKTDDDIVITGPSSFKLRAERQGKGNGRIYGVRFKVTDTSGTIKTATCKFVVPHDQSDRQGIDDGAAAGYTVNAPNW